jgi:hypothetical protein
MGGEISGAMRLFVMERAGHRCEYCLLHQDDSFTPHQIDHIVSRKHGVTLHGGTLRWLVSGAMPGRAPISPASAGNRDGLFLYFIRGALYGAITFGLSTVRLFPLRKRLLQQYVCSGLTGTTA